MSNKAHGQLRRSQIITTWGPGALLDLPKDSVIVGGLDTWGRISDLEEIIEQRLAAKLRLLTGVPTPRLYAPPADANDPGETKKGIGVWRFPEWYVVQEETGTDRNERSRRLVNRKALERGKFEGLTVSEFQSSELFSETALSSQPGCPETAFYGLGRRHEVPT